MEFEENWKSLANAIIVRAIDDYRSGDITAPELRRFVKSDYFKILSRGCVTPDSILKELNIDAEQKLGKYDISSIKKRI